MAKKDLPDQKQFLEDACLKYYYREKFDENRYELKILEWFRKMYIPKEDLERYYKFLPNIISEIDKSDEKEKVYRYIYQNIIEFCISEIIKGNYNKAYLRYKITILRLKNIFIKENEEVFSKDLVIKSKIKK